LPPAHSPLAVPHNRSNASNSGSNSNNHRVQSHNNGNSNSNRPEQPVFYTPNGNGKRRKGTDAPQQKSNSFGREDNASYDTGRLDHQDLRINIPPSSSSLMQDNGSVSPSKSIVQLYELEYERMKMRCARAEAALGESYRSLDTLNDLIVATDTSKQLASSTSVNALLDFFQQVSFIGVCFFFFFFTIQQSYIH
jgi:hypothetical protein